MNPVIEAESKDIDARLYQLAEENPIVRVWVRNYRNGHCTREKMWIQIVNSLIATQK